MPVPCSRPSVLLPKVLAAVFFRQGLLSGRCGFTLIEVMITMVIASLVLLILTAGSGFVMHQWTRQKNSLDDRLEAALFSLQIERAMAGAFPHLVVETVEGKPEKAIFFEGDDNSVSWVSTVVPGRAGGLAAWRVDSDGSGTRIIVVPAGGGDPRERLDAAEPVVVIPGLAVSVRYLEEKLRAAGEGVKRSWETAWSGVERRKLPAAVLFSFSREDGGTPEYLLVPVRARLNEQVNPVR